MKGVCLVIPVDLDRPRNLNFGLRDLRDLERHLDGKPLGDVIRDMSRMGMDAMIKALLVGLRHEDPTLNEKLVEKMLWTYFHTERKDLSVVTTAISDALMETGIFGFGHQSEGNEQRATTAS